MEELCDPLEMGVTEGRLQLVGCHKARDKTEGLDLEEQRGR